MSWLIAFNVVNVRNEFVRTIWTTLVALTEPASATDPPLPAQHGRRRHFADRPVPLILLVEQIISSTSTPTSSENSAVSARPRPPPAGSSRTSASARRSATRRRARSRSATSSLYSALYGTRFAVQSAETFARAIGYPESAGRRPARLPRRVRQDGRRRLAQRDRQSRLRRLPFSRAGLSRRHVVGDLSR